MIVRPSVIVDGRDQDALAAELATRRAGYVPEWRPSPQDPGRAIELIVARFAQAVIQRLNQAPDKNRLAFLGMLGEQLAPARSARAPIVFQLTNDAPGGEAPAGTSVAAPPPPGSSQQIVFETESDAGITAGKLVEVFSLWPGRDEYIDHSAEFLAGDPITLFDPHAQITMPHALYLAHSVLLNLSGNIVLAVEIQLLRPALDPLEIAWEYWDGQVWRGLAKPDPGCLPQIRDPNDGTNGLTASGVIKLTADCVKSDKATVNGVSGYWIRGRLTQPLPPDPARPLPEVESIRISNLVSQPFVGRLTGTARQGPILMMARALAFSAPAAGANPSPLTGQVTNEAGQPLAGATVTISDPNNTSFGQRTGSTQSDGTFSIVLDDFGQDRVLAFEVVFFAARAAINLTVPSNAAIVQLTLKLSALTLDKAFNDGTKLDTTKPFYPFGQQPQPGTVFYFNNGEIFAKPGARFRMYLPRTTAPTDNLKSTDSSGSTVASISELSHLVVWEYWNGREWTELPSFATQTVTADFTTSEILDFRVPVDLAPVAVNKDTDLWVRARLVSGGYGFTQTMTFQTGDAAGTTNTFTVLVAQPPILAAAVLAYSWQFGPFHPEMTLTYNDFRYEDHTYEAMWPGSTFFPYQRMEDVTPALYLGFDQKPPTADIGIFFEIVEQATGAAAATFVWEYWDGGSWVHVAVDDETGQLTAPGILSFIAEDDSAPLARFGTPLHWLRGRLKEDGPPLPVTATGIYPNAVWALQQRTFTDVAIGTATGQPGEVFQIAQIPILPGERLEVQELSGPRANVEWRLIALNLSGGDNQWVRKLEIQLGKEANSGDIVDGDLRLRRDKQKLVNEVWVRWYPQPDLFFSSPTDRHYAIDRARGLVFFGDGVNGRTLPADAALTVQSFKSGGGSDGNVAARAITQLLGAVSGVQAIFNPRPAEGGSDGETLQAFQQRAPASVRHAGRALTAGDYEAMVREASSAVSVVKALANRNPAGRTLPGWLTVIIIPESQEPRPTPSRGLRDEITAYLGARAPSGLVAAGRLYVTGPLYFPVDVAATLVPLLDSEAGLVDTRARQTLEGFLHPLHGGPSGDGWDFGRGVYLSDIATVLEAVRGLDFCEVIQLLVNDEVRGDFVEVPADHIVVAGTLRLNLKGARK
jgi:hypothetical protein